MTGDGQLFFNDPGITSEPLGKGVFKVKIAEEVRSGSYDLRYAGKDGTTSPSSFAVSNRDEKITPKDATVKERAVLLEGNVVMNGMIEQGKPHYYKFTVSAGSRYFVDCFAERIDSRADVLLVLTDPSGIEVARSRESIGGDPLIGFSPTVEGEYLLRVSDFLARGGEGYNYRIQLRQGPHIDFVLPLSAQPGKTQSFQIFGRNLPGGVPSGEDGLERIEINVDVPTEVLISRLSGRLVCTNCNQIYNIKYAPPKNDRVCDNCTKQLQIRDDDKTEAIQKRIQVYFESTAPLISYYESTNILVEIDGSNSISVVTEELKSILSN